MKPETSPLGTTKLGYLMTRIMISCGEPSGDLYAAALTTELRRLDDNLEVFGMGGEQLQAAGAQLLGDFRGLSVTGLSEALSVLPRSLSMYRRLLAAARAQRPDVFVPIDFPDFNLRLSSAVHRLGVPVAYYVGPQVWAWRSSRLRTLKRLAHRMFVIFPFEEDIYRRAGVPVEFVGHPLVDLAKVRESRTAFLSRRGLDVASQTVALLPGSRPNELRFILPVLVRAASMIAARVPAVQFVVARAPHLDTSLFEPLGEVVGSGGRAPVIVESQADDVIAASDVVLVASGTATIQAAIHERPMVVVYRVSPLTYLARGLLQVDTFGMVNLVAGRQIVPELIQDDFQPEAVAEEAVRFLTDSTYVARTRSELRTVRHKLGDSGASRRVAEAILNIARRRREMKK